MVATLRQLFTQRGKKYDDGDNNSFEHSHNLWQFFKVMTFVE